jgi:hypothetical protein
MWMRTCAHEDAVRRMAHHGGEDAALLAHAAACRDCQETLEIATWMRELASQPVGESERPTVASHLWWKAELLRRWDAERRALEPVEIGERIGAGIAVIGAAAIFVWLWGQIGSFSFTSVPGGENIPALPWLIIGMVLLCVVFLGATAVAGLDVGGRNRKG